MSAIKDPVTREVISSTLGAQWNDRVVQVFTTAAELKAGNYTGWIPIRGSLAYAEDTRCLYRVVDFDGNGLPVWWPVAGRGAISHYPLDSHLGNGTITLPGAGLVTTIVKVGIECRYGHTYLINFAATLYTPSGNLGLWTGETFIQRKVNPGYAINSLITAGWIRSAGQGWANGVFNSEEISGCAILGPMASNEPDAEVIWRGYSYPGLPDLLVINPTLSVCEIGGGL